VLAACDAAPPPSRRSMAARGERKFSFGFKLIWVVQSSLQK
jgi:hypothetical protein